MKEILQLFILPNQNLSLPNIANLYTTNDFRGLNAKLELLKKKKKDAVSEYLQYPDGYEYFEENNKFSQSLESCFQEVILDTSEVYKPIFPTNVEGDDHSTFSYMKPSPCLNIQQYTNCSEYCNWHKQVFKEWQKDEFIALMKYAIPQRKVHIGPGRLQEMNMAKKLFGKHVKNKLTNEMAPIPLILFCYRKDKEDYIGDDLGMIAKACNEFFPTPTYQGICLTKNLDIKEVLNLDTNYDILMEPELQESSQYVKGGTYGTENTLMFFSGNDLEVDYTDFREYTKGDTGVTNYWDGPVELMIHQSNEFARFFQDDSLIKSTKVPPFPKLERSWEYWIEVTPHVQKTTEAFKNIHLQNRGCRLQHEVHENSVFKSYTMENCRYECHVKKAVEICKCIPWDFNFIHHDRQIQECDIFGRTCFYHSVKNLTLISKDIICNHCIKECDYATYDIVEIGKKSIGDILKRKYFDVNKNTGQCTGQRALCDYFTAPINGTLIDKGLENAFNAMAFYSIRGSRDKQLNITGLEKYKDLIILHIRILKPEIKVIDAKYSTLDKFANFGGNFGIFAEITGCSFLGMLNILILLFKLIFSPRTIKLQN